MDITHCVFKDLFCYKMLQAIKSKNFDTLLFYLEAPERKKFVGFTSNLIKYDDEDCFIKVKGNFKLFGHNNKGKNFTL